MYFTEQQKKVLRNPISSQMENLQLQLQKLQQQINVLQQQQQQPQPPPQQQQQQQVQQDNGIFIKYYTKYYIGLEQSS